MSTPKDLKFTKTHEWVRVDGDVVTIGISDHAQTELGDITYLELPEIGDRVTAGEPLGIVESVKAATDIYSPVNGEVVEVNTGAVDEPGLVNESPYDRAWLLKVRIANMDDLIALLAAADYDLFAAEAGH